MKHPWRFRPRALIFISVVLFCVHAVLNTLFRGHGFLISYVFWATWSLLATVACAWRAFHCPHSIRTHWRLAAASLFFITVAALVEAPAEVLANAVPTVASIGDFFFFSAFVPILLAITLPDEGIFDRFTFFLDSIEAAACTYLAYTVLMGVFPFTSNPAQAVPYAPLEFVYDTEYVFVVVLATLRFLLGTRNRSERYFFRYLLLYTALYAITSGIYNHFVGKYSLTNGLDALNDIPSAALAIAALFAPATEAHPAAPPMRSKLVRLVDNARPIFLSLALIALSGAVALRHFVAAFAFIFGAFIVYSLRASMLQSRVEHVQSALRDSNLRLSEIAHLDSVTGIPNRRSFDQLLAKEWARAQRTRLPLSLLLIDVDHFKGINDTYGHQAGDECLRHTARLLGAALDRPSDFVARYGGDEFAILLTETGSFGASTIAARVRSAVARDAAAGASYLTTLSIGISTWHGEKEARAEQLIATADRALYVAKQNGRDRVELRAVHVLAAE